MASARRAVAALGLRRAPWGALLEEGRLDGRLTRSIAGRLDAALARSLVRPAAVPSHVRLLCVGGATLGGSGKTRLALACARALPGSVLVAHGYRARDRRARFVAPDEGVVAAGDEALLAAREGLRVVIGPTRQAAIDLAAAHADTLVLDGPLAITEPPPRRRSLLALDADQPWGSGEVVPAGDLRASRAALLALADEVVHIPRAIQARALPPRPFGLFTALARPDRLIRALAPDVTVSAPDHGPADAQALRRTGHRGPWVATPKCALHLEGLGLEVHLLHDDFEVTPTWAALTVPRGHE